MITEVDGTGTTETHYVWCGEAICQKRDANGQLLRAYYPEGEYGPEIGKRVAKADAGTETDEDGDEHDGRDQDGNDGKSAPQTESTGSLIYARNHLGSVTDTQTPDGRAVTHTEYGPYGELVKSQGRAEYRSDFGYAGMQYHAASGMYLTLFRAYDPGTGRWVSRDPIGEEGGINLYSYVNGNPISYVDQRGLDIMVITGGISNGSPPNPFGHVGVAISGYGMASYGNNTPLGSSVDDYLGSQDLKRDQQITIIPTTPIQDALAIAYIEKQHPKMNDVGYLDNCAVRTNEIINAAGIPTRGIPFPGGVARDVQSIPGAKNYYIPKGAPIPPELANALPAYRPIVLYTSRRTP
ncbi:RHS repeat-associated core domain-containing protein [Ralstonia solanacearum]|uniref:RHS repeat-associated core domain-containing protein n=1 Tax=Ralstonia solanacearum TaxID=305 RepID=UPI003CC56B04